MFVPFGALRGTENKLFVEENNWRVVPQGSPWGQTLRALLLGGTSMLHGGDTDETVDHVTGTLQWTTTLIIIIIIIILFLFLLLFLDRYYY